MIRFCTQGSIKLCFLDVNFGGKSTRRNLLLQFNAGNKIKISSPSLKTAACITSYECTRLNGAALESIMS